MSTRCQIVIQNQAGNFYGVSFYRHSDGYPHHGNNGVLSSLVPFVHEFMQNRGWDEPYMMAQLAFNQAEKVALPQRNSEWNSRPENQQTAKMFKYVGFGIEPFSGIFHADVEYIYIIRQDGRNAYVDVRKTGRGFWDSQDLRDTGLEGTYHWFNNLVQRI